MKKTLALALAAAVLATAAGCGPDGQHCDRPGSVMNKSGVNYHCKRNFNGDNVWTKD